MAVNIATPARTMVKKTIIAVAALPLKKFFTVRMFLLPNPELRDEFSL